MADTTFVSKKRIRVGIVENDPEYQRNLSDKLERIESVGKVYSWPSAEAYWRDRRGRRIHLLFLDIGLPGMDGVSLVGKINERDPQIPVLMLSNFNSDEFIFRRCATVPPAIFSNRNSAICRRRSRRCGTAARPSRRRSPFAFSRIIANRIRSGKPACHRAKPRCWKS